MRNLGPGRSGQTRGTSRTGRPSREEVPPPADRAIPVCLGEFDIDDARDFRPLWEMTWSQDVRGKAVKK